MDIMRIDELYIALHACSECMKKRVNRYVRERKVSDLADAIKKLDRMKEYIDKIQRELRYEIQKGVPTHE